MGSGSLQLCGKSEAVEIPKLVARIDSMEGLQKQTLQSMKTFGSEKTALEKQKQKLENDLAEIKKQNQRLKKVEEQKYVIQREMKVLKNTTKQLQNKLSLQTLDKDRWINNYENLQADHNKLKQQQNRLENRNQNLELKIQEFNEIKNGLQNSINNQRINNRDLSSRIFSFESQRQRIYNQLQHLHIEYQKLKQEHSFTQVEKKELNNELLNIINERQRLKNELLAVQESLKNSVSLQDFKKAEQIINKCLAKIKQQQKRIGSIRIIPGRISNGENDVDFETRRRSGQIQQIQKEFKQLKKKIYKIGSELLDKQKQQEKKEDFEFLLSTNSRFRDISQLDDRDI